jgi:outer membrane protein insertion porin family
MNIGSGLIFDKSDLVKAEQEIAKQYLGRGKYTARVVSEVVPLERNRVNINFYVEEGRISRIKSIDLVGNRVFKKDDLFDQISLKKTNLFSWYNKDDRYSRQQLSGDLENIRSFYMDRGFLDFKINSTTVSISKNKKYIYIAINIDEGDKYTIGTLEVSGKLPENFESKGEEALTLESLENELSIKKGDVFNRKLVNQSTKKMTSRLGDYGYAFANVNATPDIDKINNVVSFNFSLEPGKRIYVRRINVIGNEKTKDKVIRRELRQMEASWFSQADVDRSRARLSRTQFFDGIDIDTPGVPGVSDQVDLNIKVSERNTGSISVGAGLSSSEGIVGTLTLSQSNFLGTGNNVSTSISTGDINSVYSLSFTDPYFTDDGVSRHLSVYKKAVDTKGQLDGQAAYKTDSLGGTVSFNFPISEYNNITVGTTLDLTQLELTGDAPQAYKNYCTSVGTSGSTCDTSSWLFYTGYMKDTRNDALFPTMGTKFNVVADVTAPVLDVKYYRLGIATEKFFPWGGTVSTRLKGDVGYIDSYGGDTLPFYKKFKVGGQKTVRGYKEASIGKKVYDATYKDYITNGGNATIQFAAETFFPVPGMKKSKSMRMSAFFDAGGVFDDVSLSEMRYSVGLGGLWVSPFGPLSISFAIPLNDDEHDKTETFQFGMGTNF